MNEFAGDLFLLLIVGLPLLFIAVYVSKRKPPELPLWKAVAMFCGFFLGIAAPGIALVIGAMQLFDVNPKYASAIAIALTFGLFVPAWNFALGKIVGSATAAGAPIEVAGDEVHTTTGKGGAYRSNVRKWYSENRWQAWVAIIAIVTMIAVIGVASAQGYDMTPILMWVAFYLALAMVIGGGNWFFTKSRTGVAIGKAIAVTTKTLVKIAVFLIVAALLIWTASTFFGSMPWWAAVIIVLLVLVLLK